MVAGWGIATKRRRNCLLPDPPPQAGEGTAAARQNLNATGAVIPALCTGFSVQNQALALILGHLMHAGFFPSEVLYPVPACSSGGAI